MIKNVCWSSCKVPVSLVIFERKFNFLYIFSKNTLMSNFMEIPPVELFHADGHDETNGRFSQFCDTLSKTHMLRAFMN